MTATIRRASRALPAVPLRTIRAGQTFRDEAGMWHTAREDVTMTAYRGTPVLTVETSTGRRLYASVETIVPVR